MDREVAHQKEAQDLEHRLKMMIKQRDRSSDNLQRSNMKRKERFI
jgi:hypothetical protein